MSRLIDADAFAEFIKYAIKTQKYDVLKVNDTTLTVGDVLESVVAELEGTSIDGFKNNPTIEPQPEIVRCKDCKHYREYAGSIGGCCHMAEWYNRYQHLDDFCSRAERRQE